MPFTFFKVFIQIRACPQQTTSSVTDNTIYHLPTVQYIWLLCKTYMERDMDTSLSQYMNTVVFFFSKESA